MSQNAEALYFESAQRIDKARANSIETWQNRTLPFVQWSMGILAAIVFGTVIIAGTLILPSIAEGSNDAKQFANAAEQALKVENSNKDVALIAITAYQSTRQHDRASAALLTRELLRFCGFMIGAALCFVGAIFIVGKFSDISPSAFNAAGNGISASLTSASPGLFALIIGGILVATGILAHYKIIVDEPSLLAQRQVSNSIELDPEELSGDRKAELELFCKSDPENDICKLLN